MSEKDLCWECKEYMHKKYGTLYDLIMAEPTLHCHHEPKEKEKCWCEDARFGVSIWLWNDPTHITAEYKFTGTPKFCPECGRKL